MGTMVPWFLQPWYMVLLEFQRRAQTGFYMQKMCVEGEYETEFTTLTLRIYTALPGCVGIPFPAYSAPLLHYITTLDGTITYFVVLVYLVLFTVTSL